MTGTNEYITCKNYSTNSDETPVLSSEKVNCRSWVEKDVVEQSCSSRRCGVDILMWYQMDTSINWRRWRLKKINDVIDDDYRLNARRCTFFLINWGELFQNIQMNSMIDRKKLQPGSDLTTDFKVISSNYFKIEYLRLFHIFKEYFKL